MTKRAIKYNLPLANVSEASAPEKSVHIDLSAQFHVWWARRPLASSRVTAFAALIDNPGKDHPREREELLELIKKIIRHNSSTAEPYQLSQATWTMARTCV